jgi:aryl carrier-like protein
MEDGRKLIQDTQTAINTTMNLLSIGKESYVRHRMLCDRWRCELQE